MSAVRRMNAIQVVDRRASEAFAAADTALSGARHCRIWMTFHEDGPHTYVTSAAVVQRLSGTPVRVPSIFAAARHERLLNRLERRAEQHGAFLLEENPDDAPRRCRSHAPPGKLVTTSPHRPNGPPRCAAMNLAGTAAA